jgi:Tol biopolymer transport system component
MNKDGGSIELILGGSNHEFGPSWSYDGSKLAFMSDRTGQWEVYVSTKGETGWGEPEQITPEGGTYPMWSPVEDTIAFIDENRLKVISYKERKIKTLTGREGNIESPTPKSLIWSLDGQTIFYQAFDDNGIGSLWAIPVVGSKPEEMKVQSDNPNLRIGLYSFCSDGEHFYFSLRRSESNVWIMDLELAE